MSTPNETTPAALSPSDPLEQLNHAFRDAYAARREVVLAALGPAVAAIDDALILRLRGERHVGPARTRVYHELKTICHLPLAIQAIVGDDGGELDDAARTRLGELRRHVVAVTDALATRGFTPAQLTRQRRMLDASRELLTRLLTDGRFTADTLLAFLHAQTPDIHGNLEDAARDQLATTHATFSAWKQRMTADEWDALLVVVAASHMARTGNVAAQYFTVALGQPWEGRFQREDLRADKRVFSSEVASDEHTAFSLLAMHAFDARASNHFFAEEGRLGRDVLANATERLLAAMFDTAPSEPDVPAS
jgi:hypothetical protein